MYTHTYIHTYIHIYTYIALTSVAQFVERPPTNQKITGRFLVRAHSWIVGLFPSWYTCERHATDVSLPLFLPSFPIFKNIYNKIYVIYTNIYYEAPFWGLLEFPEMVWVPGILRGLLMFPERFHDSYIGSLQQVAAIRGLRLGLGIWGNKLKQDI